MLAGRKTSLRFVHNGPLLFFVVDLSLPFRRRPPTPVNANTLPQYLWARHAGSLFNHNSLYSLPPQTSKEGYTEKRFFAEMPVTTFRAHSDWVTKSAYVEQV